MTASSGHNAARGRQPSEGFGWATYLVGIIMILLVIAQGVATGFPGLLGSAGLIAFGTGLYSLLTGRESWLHLHSRVAAGIWLAAGLAASVAATILHWNLGAD